MPFGDARQAAVDAETRAVSRRQLLGLSPYERHVRLVAEHTRLYGRAASAPVVVSTDEDALRAAHRFLRSAEDEADTRWEARLAAKYYDRLFKEYAVADLSQATSQRVGLRWRTEREVVAGKGQFSCGARGCDSRSDLGTYEVPFAYNEAGEDKQALVKLRCCGPCAEKLHYGRSGQQAGKEKSAHKKRLRSPSPDAHRAAHAPPDDDDDEAQLLEPLMM